MKNKIRSLIFEGLLKLKGAEEHYWIIDGKNIKVDRHDSYIVKNYGKEYKDWSRGELSLKGGNEDVYRFADTKGFIRIYFDSTFSDEEPTLNISFNSKAKEVKKNLKILIKAISEFGKVEKDGVVNLEIAINPNKPSKFLGSLKYGKAILEIKKYM